MRNRTVLSLSAALGAMVFAGAAAQAAPLFNVTFNSDTAGSPPVPTAATAGGTSTEPTATVVQTGTSVLVQNGYTDSNDSTQKLGGSGDNVLVLSDSSIASSTPANQSCSVTFKGNAADAATSGKVDLDADFLLDKITNPAASGNITFTLTNSGGSKMSQVIFNYNQNLTFNSFDSSGVIIAANSTTIAHEPGMLDTVFHLKLELDLDALTQTLTLGNNAPMSGTLPTGTSFLSTALSTSTSGAGVVVLDNFQTSVPTAAPEPASLSLLGLGGLLMLRRRRSAV
jgi:hypothetical protein